MVKRIILFLGLFFTVGLLLFWEGRKYRMNSPSRGINYAGYPYV